MASAVEGPYFYGGVPHPTRFSLGGIMERPSSWVPNARFAGVPGKPAVGLLGWLRVGVEARVAGD